MEPRRRTAASRHAATSRLVAPIPEDGYAPQHVNVDDQYSDDESLLQFIQRLTVRYRSSPEIGWGRFEVLEQEQPAVLAHSISADVGRFVALHNFSDVAGRDDDHARR